MTALQEAEALVAGLSRCLDHLRYARPSQCNEGAVAHRFDTIIDLLQIMFNDTLEMRRRWEAELNKPNKV